MPLIFDDFDKYASNYREIHNQNIKLCGADSDYFSRIKVLEVKKYEQQDSLKILDLGCGDGKSAEFIIALFNKSIYNGIDISSKSINEATKKKLPNCYFDTYDGKKIPFGNQSFDIVYIACVFHHIDFKFHSELLFEATRVLKKRGRIYLFEHNPNNPITRKVVSGCPFDEDAVLLSPEYAKKLFSKASLKEIKVRYFIFFPRHQVFKLFFWLEEFLRFIPIGAQYYIRAIK